VDRFEKDFLLKVGIGIVLILFSLFVIVHQ